MQENNKNVYKEYTPKRILKYRTPNIGERFGSLTVLEEKLYKNDSGHINIKLKCDCGVITYITLYSIHVSGYKQCKECRIKNHANMLKKLWKERKEMEIENVKQRIFSK